MKTRALLFSASLLVGGFLVPLGSSSAQTDAGVPPAADNSAMNQRDQVIRLSRRWINRANQPTST